MFKKLLANLPFNPGLLDQVAFYSKRMRHESSIRRLGFGLISLGFFVQMLAVIYPAQNSLAASSNDVLNGITNKSSILSAWDNNTRNIRAIYGEFGITRQNIADIQGQQPNATVISSKSNNYWSVGRHKLSDYDIDGSKWGERQVKIPGDDPVYERPLHAWDTYASSTYKAFQGKNKYGESFWILQTCGNPTFVGPYLPTPPAPKLIVHKTLLTSSVVQPGDTVKFRLEYQNTVDNSLATNFKLTDTLDSNLTFVSLGYLSDQSGNKLTIDHGGNLGHTDTPVVTTLVVKVKDSAPNGKSICNAASASSDQASANSERPCFTVVVPQKPNLGNGTCAASTTKDPGTSQDFTVRTSASLNNAQVTGYDYYLDGSSALYAHDQVNENPHDKKFTGLGTGSHEIQVYVDIAAVGNQVDHTSVCVARIDINENPRINSSKSVSNLTKNIDNANNTKASGGDILQFKLITQNVTSTDYSSYDGQDYQDYFGNVLQYADIVDPSQLTGQGISLDSKNYLHWQIPTIKANDSDVKKINVRVKSDIPATNSPSTLSPDYNCSITNTYGDQVNVAVDCSVIKTVTQTASELPNTGAGSSVVIGAVVASVAGYLFMRSRIMTEELEIVRQDYISAGGL